MQIETKPTNREGKGPPAADLGTIGDRYTDTSSGEVWAKRKEGWTNRSTLVLHPTIRQKGDWIEATKVGGLNRNLEAWVFKTLDAAAK